jgi:hypothetical protein
LAFEQLRTTLGGARAVRKLGARAKQRYCVKAAARFASDKRDAEAALAKLDQQRLAAEAAALAAGVSVQEHALQRKRGALAAEKLRFESRLAALKQAERFYCRRPECCKPNPLVFAAAAAAGPSAAAPLGRPAFLDSALVRAGAVSKQALAAAKDAAAEQPMEFKGARQYQVFGGKRERERDELIAQPV